MSKIIDVDGLVVEVTRKRIKRINLRIREPEGKISVSAPYAVGDREIISFIRAHGEWIRRNLKRVRDRAAAHPEPVSAAEKKLRREALRSRISRILPEIERRTGLRCNGWTVRDMRSRWGSCNTCTRHVNFSLMLATRSDREIEYVILHELVHTAVPDHGEDFRAMMDRFMPGWKSIRKGMKY